MHRPVFLRAVVVGAIVASALTWVAAAVAGNRYAVHPLVSDNGVPGTTVDHNLVNAWGLVAGPTTPWWVANNGTDSSTLYAGTGTPVPLVVSVGGGPTGLVFNGSMTDFMVSDGTSSGVARFIFASEDGKIAAGAPASLRLPRRHPPCRSRRRRRSPSIARPRTRSTKASRSRKRMTAQRGSTRPTSITHAWMSSTVLGT